MFALLLLLLCGPAALLHAQQPFNTDDAEVTDYHRFHLECADEFDILAQDSYPNLRQNTLNCKVAFGAVHNVEVGLDNQHIVLFNANSLLVPRTAAGLGDLDFSVKWKICPEKGRRPAFAMSFAFEAPTGDASKQLGSGLFDYVGNGIMQKSLTDKTTLRVNLGIVFAGNTLTGAVGLKTRGTVFTGASSLVRKFTERLQLGAELTGAATANFDLARGAMQGLAGGNYVLNKKMTFDFGLTAGTFPGAPRVGGQIGISVNF